MAVSAAVSLGGESAPASAQAAGRAFDPVAFFSGRTEGIGTLDQVTASPRATRVTGTGVAQAGGVFVLDQAVQIEGDSLKRRQWQLRQTAPGRFTGTLSDARGPVTVTVSGSQMRIAYTMKDGGMRVEQALTLAPDGRSAANHMKVRKFGVVVATLVETIRKI